MVMTYIFIFLIKNSFFYWMFCECLLEKIRCLNHLKKYIPKQDYYFFITENICDAGEALKNVFE